MKVCVDFTRIIPKVGNPYHGGGYYTYQIINGLIELIQNGLELTILWPNGYEARIEYDKKILENKMINHKFTSDMFTENYHEYNTLFLPIIDPWNFKQLKKIKDNFTELRIIVTLHDLRIIDVMKYDKYNKYYYSKGMMEYLAHLLHRKITFIKCKSGLKMASKCVDFIMTVSNYSMQRIIEYTKPISINYFYQTIDESSFPEEYITDDFILFVSAQREEKNFIRTLEAYCMTISETDNYMPLFVTGADDNFLEVIKRNKKIDLDIVNKNVHFLGYVCEEKMQYLYSHCSFLLYTSKSEGFGVPVLNAAIYGRPVVASNRTSVPEVLGSVAIYVDPYDVASIANGIQHMTNSNTRREYMKIARDYVPTLKRIMDMGKTRMISTIVSKL